MSEFIVKKVIPFLPDLPRTTSSKDASSTSSSKLLSERNKQSKFSQPSIVLLICTKYLLYGCLPYQASAKPVGENLFGILEKTPTICFVKTLELTISLARTSLKCLVGMTFLRSLKLSSMGTLRSLEDRDIAHLDNNNLKLLEELELTTGHRLTDQSIKVIGNGPFLQASLRVLKLRGLLDVTTDGGYDALGNLRNLRVFHLIDSFLANSLDNSVTGYQHAAKSVKFLTTPGSFRLLEELKIENCSGFNRDQQMGPVVRNLPRLRSLSVKNNDLLSAESISISLFNINPSDYNLRQRAMRNPNDNDDDENNQNNTENDNLQFNVREEDTDDDDDDLPIMGITNAPQRRNQYRNNADDNQDSDDDDDDDDDPIIVIDPRKTDDATLRIIRTLRSLDIGTTAALHASPAEGTYQLLKTMGCYFSESALCEIGLRGLDLRPTYKRSYYLPGEDNPFGGPTLGVGNKNYEPLEFAYTFFAKHFFDRVASPFLTKLDLSHSRIGDGVILMICTSPDCCNLKDLNIAHCVHLTDVAMQFLIRHHLHNHPNNNENLMERILNEADSRSKNRTVVPRSTPVRSNRSQHVNAAIDVWIKKIVEKMKKDKSFRKRTEQRRRQSFSLRVLDISRCQQFTSCAFDNFHKSMPDLEELYMTDLMEATTTNSIRTNHTGFVLADDAKKTLDVVYKFLLAKNGSPFLDSSSSNDQSRHKNREDPDETDETRKVENNNNNNQNSPSDTSTTTTKLQTLWISSYSKEAAREMDAIREFGKRGKLKLKVFPRA